MKVRACWKCWQYITIHPNDAKNQLKLQKFEKSHAGHGLLTMELDEVKNRYENVSYQFSEQRNYRVAPL
ncbi:MAG: hypothetical protein R6U96_19095 [Promethearchaeia archaeon]